MALSNAERQARYKQRLRDAAKGVTSETVVEAARILSEWQRSEDDTWPAWEDFLAGCRQKRNKGTWPNMVPDDVRPDAYDFLEGEDRALVERVAAVVYASRLPPPLAD